MTLSRDLFRECRRRYAGRFEREPGPCRAAVNWLAAYLAKHPGAGEDECKTAAEEDRGVSPTVLAIIYMLVVVAIECWKLWNRRETA